MIQKTLKDNGNLVNCSFSCNNNVCFQLDKCVSIKTLVRRDIEIVRKVLGLEISEKSRCGWITCPLISSQGESHWYSHSLIKQPYLFRSFFCIWTHGPTKPKSCKLQDDIQVLGCCNASDSWQFQLSPTACPVAACWTRTCIWEKSNGSQGELNRFEISMGISWHPVKRFNIPTPHRLY